MIECRDNLRIIKLFKNRPGTIVHSCRLCCVTIEEKQCADHHYQVEPEIVNALILG